jgi:mannose-1-phosphate guanylyltransferase
MVASPHAFILAGGRGTRFWPLSTAKRPKQLLDFTGEGSLLALTVSRLTPLIPPERQWVITGGDLVDAVREAVPQIPAHQVIAEPVGRNTAPAVGLAAAILAERGEDAAFAVLPSDHLIEPGDEFRACLGRALDLAAAEPCLFTFGIRPTRPETGYGYIEAAEGFGDHDGIRRVAAFTEKPEVEMARDYLASGRHWWNSGMFCWRSSTVLDGLAAHAPELLEVVSGIAKAGSPGTAEFSAALQEGFASAPSISIDYALMEKAENVLVVDATFGWNDVGHWLAMRDLWPSDGAGNVVRGELLSIDASENIVYGPDRLTALIGVEGHIVVSTDDVTLVCPADRAQDVKLALQRLEESGAKNQA